MSCRAHSKTYCELWLRSLYWKQIQHLLPLVCSHSLSFSLSLSLSLACLLSHPPYFDFYIFCLSFSVCLFFSALSHSPCPSLCPFFLLLIGARYPQTRAQVTVALVAERLLPSMRLAIHQTRHGGMGWEMRVCVCVCVCVCV